MIEPISPDQPASSAQSSSGIGRLDSDAFLQLLVAQMRYQNPMEPTDGTAMLQQTAQFTTVETLQSISELQSQLAHMQQVSLAVDVVGKEITALELDGSAITGTVDGVRFTADGAMLQVEGTEVLMENVVSVTEAPQTQTETQTQTSEG